MNVRPRNMRAGGPDAQRDAPCVRAPLAPAPRVTLAGASVICAANVASQTRIPENCSHSAWGEHGKAARRIGG